MSSSPPDKVLPAAERPSVNQQVVTKLFSILVLILFAACVSRPVQQVGVGECRGQLQHGPYELRVVGGSTIVEGTFVEGKKHGVFTFYTTGRTKIAEIPYENDEKNGTIRLWYGEFAFPESAGRLKLESRYLENVASGRKVSWWPSGAKRTDETFVNGSSTEAKAWNGSGERLSPLEAEQVSARDIQADAKFYEILESEIDAYPPVCTMRPTEQAADPDESAGHTAEPAALDECFAKCRKLTDRSNEECFDVCRP